MHPRALEYVAARLQGLQRLKLLKDASPVEYLHARVADLDDYKLMESVQRLLPRVKRLQLGAAVRSCHRYTPFVCMAFACIRLLLVVPPHAPV